MDASEINVEVKLPDQVEDQLKKLREAKASRAVNAVSAWGYKDGTIHVANYHYCHASMDQVYHGNHEKLEVLLSQYQLPVVDEKKIIDYFEWLFNYSPFADAFITKSAKSVIKDKGLVLNPDMPYNYVGGALIASRLGTERYTAEYKIPAKLLLWHELVEKGIHPNLAFTLAHHGQAYEIKGENLNIQDVKSYIWDNKHFGHETLTVGTALITTPNGFYVKDPKDTSMTYPSWDMVHGSFFHNLQLGVGDSTFRKKGRRDCSSYLWVGKDGWKVAKKYPDINFMIFKELTRQLKPSEKTSNNPFAKAKPQVNDYKIFNFHDMIDVIAGMKGQLMEIIENKDLLNV